MFVWLSLAKNEVPGDVTKFKGIFVYRIIVRETFYSEIKNNLL